jgi:phosphoribosyl 1,2-cyclic phosphodiesterase
VRSWVLGTGSRGNAVLLEADGSRVLVDAGFPIRALVRRLRAIGVAPQDIEAVIITHEHRDHVRAAAAGARAYGWRVFATAGTIAADPRLGAAAASRAVVGESIALTTMDVATIPVPHDAASPIAVVVTARRTGVRIGVAYDLGHATEAVRRGLARLDVLILESNHDEGMLRAGPYPPMAIDRIAGPNGHLSNAAAADLVCSVAHSGLACVVLAHLSEINNDPRLALRGLTAALARARRTAIRVSAANQATVEGPFAPRHDGGPEQFTLAI